MCPASSPRFPVCGCAGRRPLCRDGYPVNPDNIDTALSAAVQQFADAGLTIPLVTAPGDFNQPDVDYAERYYAACGAAGVRHIKLGYWHWHPGMDYWDEVARVRDWLAGFQKLSKKRACRRSYLTAPVTRWV